MAAVTLVALIVRHIFVLFPTGDSVNFMVATYSDSWMSQIDNLGFVNFFRIESAYSPFFLFMLAILSLLPKGKVVNIDTGAISRGYRTAPYPAKPLRDYILSRGGRLILSSDAHRKEDLMFGFEALSSLSGSCDYSFLDRR